MQDPTKKLSASVAHKIDHLCDRFEVEWQAGQRPTIEQFLLDWDGPERDRLLQELLRLEWDLRREQGETVDYEAYHRRFPDQAELINYALRFNETLASPGSTAAEGRKTAGRPNSWGKTDCLDLAGRLEIESLHATGGLGEVYVAHDSSLHRQVAVKRIKDGFHGDSTSRRRFLLEAEVTGRLEHPGIVPIHGQGTDESGHPFYVMKFIRGVTLKQRIDDHFQNSRRGRKRDLGFRRLLTHFVAACRAIDFAHSRGIIHRDIKPTNIMLGEYGETQVVDWGLAKILDQPESLVEEPAAPQTADTLDGVMPTQIGIAIGTPAYMSPEQAAGAVDQMQSASDVYSLGATLYYLLTNHPPFRDDSVNLVIAKVQLGEFPRPRSLRRGVPAALDAVCMKAMQLDPADRYRSAADLADDIEAYLGDQPVGAWREPVRLRAQRFLRRRQNLMLGAMLLMALFATGLVANAYQRERDARYDEIRHADSARRVSKIFEGLYGGLVVNEKPTFLLGVDHHATDLMTAAKQVEDELGDDENVQARLMDTLGEHFAMMGDLQNGERFLSRALTLRQRHPENAEDLAASKHHVAFLRWCQGYIEDAHQLASQAVTMRTELYGNEDEKTIASQILLMICSAELREKEDPRYQRAVSERHIAAWRDILDAKTDNSPAADPDIAGIYAAISFCQAYLDQPLAAAASLATAKTAYAAYADSDAFQTTGMEIHPGELFSKVVASFIVHKFPLMRPVLGQPEELKMEALEMSKFAFHRNETHPGNLWVRLVMSRGLEDLDISEAEQREVLALARQSLDGQPRLIDFLRQLAETLQHLSSQSSSAAEREQRLNEAENLMNEALQLAIETLGPDHWRVAETYKILGRIERQRGDLPAAEARFVLSLESFNRGGVRGIQWLDVQLRGELAAVIEGQGRSDEAAELRQESQAAYLEFAEQIPTLVKQAYRAAPALGSPEEANVATE